MILNFESDPNKYKVTIWKGQGLFLNSSRAQFILNTKQ